MATLTQIAEICPWLESYSVGIPAIDTQHKELVRLINELHAAMMLGKAKQALGKTLDDVVKYTQRHFADEERLMKTMQYTRFLQHKAEHAKLTRQVLELQGRFHDAQLTLTLEVMRFLKDWLANHIAQHDHAYAREFAGIGR